MISEELKATIRSRVDLATVIRESGVPLRSSGGGWRGPCPFEKSRSGPTAFATKFSVRGEWYHCFACPRTGDIFDWIAHRDKVSFQDAAVTAAKLAGISLEHVSPLIAEADAHRVEIIEHLAALSRERAQGRRPSANMIAGINCTAAIWSGELGIFPRLQDLRAALSAIDASPDAFASVGLEDRSTDLANQWVLWGTARGQVNAPVIAGRVLGVRGPVIGVRGARSVGWVSGCPQPGARIGLLTADDFTYLTLRSQGVERIGLPLTQATLTHPRGLPGLQDRRRPPALLVTPTDVGRRRALHAATALLAWSPYLCAVEVPPRALLATNATEWRAACIRACRASGHVLDWQMQRLQQDGDLTSDITVAAARERLSRLVAAIPVRWRPFYAEEVERRTGLTLDPAIVTFPSDDAARAVPRYGMHARAT